MNNMTNGSMRSDIIKQQTMRRLQAEGYCFEGDRYPVQKSPDSKYAKKKKATSKKK
jgi:hypothetical protein